MNGYRAHYYGLLCLTLLCLSVGFAAAQTLTSFENAQAVAIVSPSGLQAAPSEAHATDGKSSLRVVLKGSEKDTWPGLRYVPQNPDLSACAILAYDVFLEGEAPLTISCRIDDAAGKTVFTSANVNPGKNTIEIWLVNHKFELDLKHIACIYPYFSKPRRDAVLYFDNFRCQSVSARFKPLIFEETNPPLQPSAADQERGYQLFARPWTASVFPNSVPLATELNPRLEIFGTPGQVVPVTFCVRSLQALGETAATVSDLKFGRKVLPAAAVGVFPVSYRDKRRTYSSDLYIKDMPTILEERSSVPIAAGRTQLFWLNVTIPLSAAPGTYGGEVTVTPGTGKPATLPLQVRVLPFKLSEPKHMLWGEYYTGNPLAKTLAEKCEAIKRDLADQRAHGMTSVGLCFGMEHTEYQVEGTKVTLNPDPQGRYVTFMNTYKQLGFPLPLIQLSDDGQAAAGQYKLGSPEWEETYKNFWIAVAAYHKQQGWPEVIVQPVDEPGWQGPEERERNIVCLKALKQIPGQRTEQDGPGDSYFLTEAGPFADVWNFNGALQEDSIIKQAQKRGHLITTYNNDVESYRPEMGRYCNGFYQLRAGARGTYNWAYISMAGNPYDDQDANTGSWMHVYPAMPQLGEVGGSSTGWEGARAGIDDYKYAHTLRRAIEQGLKSQSRRARQAAVAGQATLEQVLGSLDYNYATRSTDRFTETKPRPEGGQTVHGPLKVPNGWDFANYDRARWQLAAATIDILAALGEIGKPQPPAAPAPAKQETLLQEPVWTPRPTDRATARLGGEKQLNLPVLSAQPTVDGDLTDAVWQQAAKIDEFTLMDGRGKPSQQTHAWVYSDGRTLYLAAEMLEENIANLTARINQDGGPVWNDDDLEIFIDPNLSRSSFLQICINALGKVYLSHPTDKQWKPELQRATLIDKAGKRWTVELGLPLASLGLTSNVFGFNVARERRPLESLELSCWSPTGSGFGVPQRFGVASIGGSYLGSFKVGAGTLGSNDFIATIRNDDTKPHQFLVILDWKQGKKVALYRQSGPLELQPGQSQEVKLTYELVTDKDPVALGLAVKDAATGVTYAQRHIQQQPLPVLKLTLRPQVYFLGDAYGQLQAEVALSPSLVKQTSLLVALFDGKGNLLRKQTLPVANERLNAALNLSGLRGGSYRVEVAVKSGEGVSARRLVTAKTMVTKVAGPFD